MTYKIVLNNQLHGDADLAMYQQFEDMAGSTVRWFKKPHRTMQVHINRELGLWNHDRTSKRGHLTWCAYKPAGELWLRVNTPLDAKIICDT